MKKEDLRIVFMGTPDFAVSSLEKIINEGYNVVGVITAPDKQSGRGRKINESAVKKFALKHQLNILQPTNLKDDNFIKQLKDINPNIQVVVAFRMLPAIVWKLPKYGTFNLHASLLPQYRGAAPINYAIINGEKQTGVTTFFLDDKIDTGKIIEQKTVNIADNDNAGTLHDKLMTIGSEIVIKTLSKIISDNIQVQDQEILINKDSVLHSAPKILKENCKINWNNKAEKINNFIRGLSPYPGAYAILSSNDNEEILVKIYSSSFSIKKQVHNTGHILSDNKNYIDVVVENGILHINELQLAGKKRMSASELLRGFNKISEYSFK